VTEESDQDDERDRHTKQKKQNRTHRRASLKYSNRRSSHTIALLAADGGGKAGAKRTDQKGDNVQ
jgi:hypothetical protein